MRLGWSLDESSTSGAGPYTAVLSMGGRGLLVNWGGTGDEFARWWVYRLIGEAEEVWAQ